MWHPGLEPACLSDSKACFLAVSQNQVRLWACLKKPEVALQEGVVMT